MFRNKLKNSYACTRDKLGDNSLWFMYVYQKIRVNFFDFSWLFYMDLQQVDVITVPCNGAYGQKTVPKFLNFWYVLGCTNY